jgi:branched-chain amino acid transport system permease protein
VTSLLGVLFDGITYGCLLFVMSIGLSVTMGLMNFINLAHGAFAMVGGYVCVVAMTRSRAVPGHAAARLHCVGRVIILERTLYQRLTGAALGPVMFSIGLVFVVTAARPTSSAVATAGRVAGVSPWAGSRARRGSWRVSAVPDRAVILITVALHLLLVGTRFSAQVRVRGQRHRRGRYGHQRQSRFRGDVRPGFGLAGRVRARH